MSGAEIPPPAGINDPVARGRATLPTAPKPPAPTPPIAPKKAPPELPTPAPKKAPPPLTPSPSTSTTADVPKVGEETECDKAVREFQEAVAEGLATAAESQSEPKAIDLSAAPRLGVLAWAPGKSWSETWGPKKEQLGKLCFDPYYKE